VLDLGEWTVFFGESEHLSRQVGTGISPTAPGCLSVRASRPALFEQVLLGSMSEKVGPFPYRNAFSVPLCTLGKVTVQECLAVGHEFSKRVSIPPHVTTPCV
jgi:hypothetical protein